MHCNFYGMSTMYTDTRSWGLAITTAEFQKFINCCTMRKNTWMPRSFNTTHILQTFQRIVASHPIDNLQQIRLLVEIQLLMLDQREESFQKATRVSTVFLDLALQFPYWLAFSPPTPSPPPY